MKIIIKCIIMLMVVFIFSLKTCPYPDVNEKYKSADYVDFKNNIISRYSWQKPVIFSLWPAGVKTRIRTDKKIIALTFDGCGGTAGKRLDWKIINYLKKEGIPATLFVSGNWIDLNHDAFLILSSSGLFDIANHGLEHRPLSVRGFEIYNMTGTRSVSEAVDEVELNARKIRDITGKSPAFYRSAGAHYDDIGVRLVYDLGETPVNFTGTPNDSDLSLHEDRVFENIIRNSRSGSIILLHMNHPEKNTGIALARAVKFLKEKGFSFVKLRDYVDDLI
ncbi:MAG: polysaccharide deacetylase family protein [Spirochaetes bacterium]|nr:polysaccharide deacetylase family protein [Spirochaetota bacterium]